jgi:hypothetical protein
VGAAVTGIASYTDIAQTKAGKWLAGALAIVPGALLALTFANGVAGEVLGVHADPATLALLSNSALGAGVVAFGISAVAWARAAFTKVKGE